jgi:hypothetical protein
MSITTLLEVGQWNSLPHTIRKMTYQQFINQVDRPEDEVDDEQDDVVVIIPTYHQGIDAQQTIEETSIAATHSLNIIYYL